MLNFTYCTNTVSGQFNGRYAFRSRKLQTPTEESHLLAIATGDDRCLEDDIYRHEYFHWLVFSRSYIGKVLIGRRFFVRAAFLKGDYGSVVTYYKQRTAYFLSSYRAHESLVERLEKRGLSDLESIRKCRLGRDEVDEITSADGDSRVRASSLGTPFRFRDGFFGLVLGSVATREFGVQAYLPSRAEESGVRLYEVSLKGRFSGIVNAPTDEFFAKPDSLFVRLGRWVVRSANVERWFGRLNKTKLAHWTYLKFRTELEVLSRDGTIDVESHLYNYIEFVRGYLGRDLNVSTGSIVSLLLGCQDYESDVIVDLLVQLDEDFLYFFYAHGN